MGLNLHVNRQASSEKGLFSQMPKYDVKPMQLTYNPNHARPCLGLIQILQIFTQCTNHRLIFIWIFAENIL